MEHYIAYAGLINVSLAAMNRDYLPIMIRNANNPRVTAGVMLRPPATLEAQTVWYESIAKRSEADHVFAILLREGKGQYRYIGHTGLHGMKYPSGHAKTGSLILEEDCLRKGYGTEAKLLLLYHAFFVRGLRKVSSEVKAFNGNSWGHLLKCGYRPIGRRARHHFHEGDYVDGIMFEVFREDFEPIWEEYRHSKKLPTLSDEQRAIITKR